MEHENLDGHCPQHMSNYPRPEATLGTVNIFSRATEGSSATD